MNEFWLKYLLRVSHIGSIILLSHKTIADFFTNSISSDHAIFYSLLGLVAILSGIFPS
jgi:hypothetical protein